MIQKAFHLLQMAASLKKKKKKGVGWGENTEQFLLSNWRKEVTLDRFMPTESKNYTQLEETNKSTVS